MRTGLKKQVEEMLTSEKKTAAWQKAIDAGLAELERQGKAELVRLRYFENKKEDEIMERLYITRSTYFAWKNDCIIEFILQALQAKLLTL